MMNRILIILLILIVPHRVFAQVEVDFSGQLSLQNVTAFTSPILNHTGLRYLPELKLGSPLTQNLKVESLLAMNLTGAMSYRPTDSLAFSKSFKPYRLTLQISGDQSELRLGLQKINFGSATMLRPLMWFDKMDPRDPLQLTDGVYGLMFRHFFLNNTNAWIWLLYGNKDVKGWEQFSTASGQPELGGRLQWPVGRGELALSSHYRMIDPSKTARPGFVTPFNGAFIPEVRLGIDGKWDLQVGLWFEASLEYADINQAFPDLDLPTYTEKVTIGADYTFGVGNGLALSLEQFQYGSLLQQTQNQKAHHLSAIALNYPLSMFISATAMVYYDWTNNSWYRFLNFQLTYDRLSFYLMGYWNPEIFGIYQPANESHLFSGKGIQIMLVYNH